MGTILANPLVAVKSDLCLTTHAPNRRLRPSLGVLLL